MTTCLGNHLFEVKNEKHHLWPKLVPLSVSLSCWMPTPSALLPTAELPLSLLMKRHSSFLFLCYDFYHFFLFLFLWISISLFTCPIFSCMKWSESCSVVSDSLWPHGLYSLWNSPGQNTRVGSLSLLQGIFPTQGLNPGLPHWRRILYQLSHKVFH